MSNTEVKELIDRLTELPENWDSYGGLASTKESAEMAKTIVDALPDHGWQAFPSPDGGVQICCYEKGHEIEIDILYNKVEIGGKNNDRTC